MVFRVLYMPNISKKIAFHPPTRGLACYDRGDIASLPSPGATPDGKHVLIVVGMGNYQNMFISLHYWLRNYYANEKGM